MTIAALLYINSMNMIGLIVNQVGILYWNYILLPLESIEDTLEQNNIKAVKYWNFYRLRLKREVLVEMNVFFLIDILIRYKFTLDLRMLSTSILNQRSLLKKTMIKMLTSRLSLLNWNCKWSEIKNNKRLNHN
jgi:hypothetical protein